MKKKHEHVYLDWNESNEILYTRPELVKSHKNFSHRASHKLFSLLKLTRPSKTNAETRRSIEEIQPISNTYQRISHNLIRFKVATTSREGLKFGDELSTDLMFFDVKAVLHIVDTTKRFLAATLLDSNRESYAQSVEDICLVFVQTWHTVYPGYPHCLRTGQGSV